MLCKCGGQREVRLVDGVGLKMYSCGRGEFIPQSKPQEITEFRARVGKLQGREL